MGMLTKKKRRVFATAPARRYQLSGAIDTANTPIPHHIRISPR